MLVIKKDVLTGIREVVFEKDWGVENAAMSCCYDPNKAKKIHHSNGTLWFGEAVFTEKANSTYERIKANFNR